MYFGTIFSYASNFNRGESPYLHWLHPSSPGTLNPLACAFPRPPTRFRVPLSPPPHLCVLLSSTELREVRCRGELRPTTSSPPAAYRTPVLCRTLGGTLPARGCVRAPSTIVPVLLLASHARSRCAHVRRSRSVHFLLSSLDVL